MHSHLMAFNFLPFFFPHESADAFTADTRPHTSLLTVPAEHSLHMVTFRHVYAQELQRGLMHAS